MDFRLTSDALSIYVITGSCSDIYIRLKDPKIRNPFSEISTTN